MKVTLMAAISLDGYIAQEKTQVSTAWTSAEDKALFREKSKETGVVIMGSTTFATVGQPLPDRLNIIYTRQSKSELVAKYGLSEAQTGEEVLRVTQLSPTTLIKQLQAEGFKQVLVCGGSSIYTQFLQAGMINRLLITVEPVAFGSGIKLFAADEPFIKKFKLITTTKLNDQGTLSLEYESKN